MGYTHTRKPPKSGPPTEFLTPAELPPGLPAIVTMGSGWGNGSGCDNIFIGYNAGCVGIGPDTPWPTEAQAKDDAPATWTCAYCDRENHGDRLTCAGCQAGRPREAEEESVEIRVYSDVDIAINIDSSAAKQAVDAAIAGFDAIRAARTKWAALR